MELKEAFDIIGLPKSSSEDELKVAYKKLAKQYHPDIYKENPDKFKKINEAYQLIQDYKKDPNKYDNPQRGFSRSPFGGVDMGGFGVSFEDLINHMHGSEQRQREFNFPPINIKVSLSFKESVLGVDKEISYGKFTKCNPCDGKGSRTVGNGCKACNGQGKITQNNRGMIFIQTCQKCNGKDIKSENCKVCNNQAVNKSEIKLTIHIPPATVNNSTLRLRGAGHFAGAQMFGDAYSDAFINVSVEPDNELKLEGNDVVSELNISLLEALKGCDKEIKTIFDTRTINVPALIKNKDEINIKDCGVKNLGSQRIKININYPKNKDSLIEFLEKEI